MIYVRDLLRGLKLTWPTSSQSRDAQNPRKRQLKLKQTNSFQNRQLQSMCRRRQESTKSHRSATTTSSTMIEKYSLFLTYFWLRLSSKLFLRLKKKQNWMKLESSKLSIQRDKMLIMNHGSKKSDAKAIASNKRTRPSTIHEQRENNKLRQCTSFSVWIFRRTSCKAASWARWTSLQSNRSGETRSKINYQLHSRISYSQMCSKTPTSSTSLVKWLTVLLEISSSLLLSKKNQ